MNKEKIDNKKVDKTFKKSNTSKKKIKNYVRCGIITVKATFNNTRVTITDQDGNVLCWTTSGKAKFKGSSKSTAYAAQIIASEISKKANQTFGMIEAEVRVNGPGPGREPSVRAIAASGIVITLMRDVTPIPHNGCRPPKRRRI